MLHNSFRRLTLDSVASYQVYKVNSAAFVELLKAYEVGKHMEGDQKLKVAAAARMVGLEIRHGK